jgi:hypothetical protein
MQEKTEKSEPRSRGLGASKCRLRDNEIQRRRMEAAVAVVETTGLAVSLDHLSFGEVVQRSGVWQCRVIGYGHTRKSSTSTSSVRLAGPTWQGLVLGNEETFAPTTNVVFANRNKLSLPEEQQWLVREAIRQVTSFDFEALAVSKQSQTYVALAERSSLWPRVERTPQPWPH